MLRNKEHFSFSYNDSWLTSTHAQKIDPALKLYSGNQHNADEKNFRAFLDSCPDRWGRLLMNRREAIKARRENRKAAQLNEIDFLLGVHDHYRMGALRFKRDLKEEFLDLDENLAAPPIAMLRELENAVNYVESHKDPEDATYINWMRVLTAPGSSLGGARPKANVVDADGQLWIAKFPSRHDDHDMAMWEFVTYELATAAGIDMATSEIHRFDSDHHTFLTKRFDRTPEGRLHFSSAMTQLGYDDGEDGASYIELAEFLTEQGANTKEDLAQLWRRIVFNIAVSNTDDHLRNHGFIHQDRGWILSPAYDLNPNSTATGLHLNISDTDNSLDFELAMDVIDIFRLSKSEAKRIKQEVLATVMDWQKVASRVGISMGDQQLMRNAFNFE